MKIELLLQPQYRWTLAMMVTTLVGSIIAMGAGMGGGDVRRKRALRIQGWTTALIGLLFVLLIRWENNIGNEGSQGWWLLITFPWFIVCFLGSILLCGAHWVRLRI